MIIDLQVIVFHDMGHNHWFIEQGPSEKIKEKHHQHGKFINVRQRYGQSSSRKPFGMGIVVIYKYSLHSNKINT